MQYHAIPCNTMQYHALPCNTMQYHAIPCNTMQYNAIPCNTMQYHAISFNTMHYHAIPCNTMQYHAILCNTMQYHAIPCNTMQYHAIPWNINNCWRSVPLPCGQYNGHFFHCQSLHFKIVTYATTGLDQWWPGLEDKVLTETSPASNFPISSHTHTLCKQQEVGIFGNQQMD